MKGLFTQASAGCKEIMRDGLPEASHRSVPPPHPEGMRGEAGRRDSGVVTFIGSQPEGTTGNQPRE